MIFIVQDLKCIVEDIWRLTRYRGIPLTDAIRKKAIFHVSFSSRSSLFRRMKLHKKERIKCLPVKP